MRITTLIFGILGAVAAGFLGATWLSDLNEMKAAIEALGAAGADTSELAKVTWASYLLLGGAVLGLVDGVLGFKGRGKIAAGILIVAAAAPVVFAPKAIIFTCLLALAGVFAFFARPKAETAPIRRMATAA